MERVQKHHLLLIGVFSLLLLIVSKGFLADGMFMDGLIYTTIGRNMSEGMGSFWAPYFSDFLMTDFRGHPPLVLGIHSVLYSIFGDSIYVERIYSLFTYILTGVFVVGIWKQISQSIKTAWIPLLMWILVAEVSWALPMDMLENTMTVFIYASIYYYLSFYHSKKQWTLILSGLFLFLGLMSKGLVCLYVWTLPMIWNLYKSEEHWLKKGILQTVILVLSSIVPILGLYYLNADAKAFFNEYIRQQLIGSFDHAQTVDHRFYILIKFFENIIAPLVLGLILIFFMRRKTVFKELLQNRRIFGFLMFFVATGVLPVMISMKQRGFYILSVYPIFAIAWSLFLLPAFHKVFPGFNSNKGRRPLLISVAVLIVLMIVLNINSIGTISRNQNMIHDVKIIVENIEAKNIHLCPEQRTNWSLHGYFARYGKIGLDVSPGGKHKYFLCPNVCFDKNRMEGYEKMELGTKEYHLYLLKKDVANE